MTDVLFVSKPVAPPWNDSSKNLVRDLAESMVRHTPVVLGRDGAPAALARGRVEAVYGAGAGGYSPPLVDNLRVLARLALGRRAPLWHFFFAPNPRTSGAAKGLRALRRARTVQTVCSAPHASVHLPSVLFADVTVVLSAHTEARVRDAGIAEDRVLRIPPCVDVGRTRASLADRRALREALGWPVDPPTVVYPGDLEFGGGATLVLDALAQLDGDVALVLACRPKTPAAAEADRTLRAEVSKRGWSHRVRFAGETPRIFDVLAAADVVALPSTSLYAKMDYPLVLLEALALGVPVVVSRGVPAEELGDGDTVLVADATADAVATSLAALLGAGAEAARARGRRASVRAGDAYGPRPMAQAYEALYDRLLA